MALLSAMEHDNQNGDLFVGLYRKYRPPCTAKASEFFGNEPCSQMAFTQLANLTQRFWPV